MDFAEMLTTLRQEKEEKAQEHQKRNKASKVKAADLLRSLKECVHVHGIDRTRVELDSNIANTVMVESRGESVQLIVVEPDKFTLKRFVGAEGLKPVSNADEEAMMRALLSWMVPDLKA